jgi:acetylornithine deacetylase/succinyl-diaminopimelate desuccinylase-like protein
MGLARRAAPGAGRRSDGRRPDVDHQPHRAPRFGGDGPTVALNAHGDVVPPGEGWTHDPYGGEIVDGRLYGRAAAVSKSDFATYTFALRALEPLAAAAAARARSSCTSPTTRNSAASSARAGCCARA